jgi:SAM-dependent methyltransferase
MSTVEARYDGIAEWYDRYNAANAELNAVELAALLGPGEGLCLDLGCGTGQYLDAIRGTGRIPIGLDFSAGQLRVAARRDDPLVQADAAAIPFAEDTFPTVVIMWISTDVDDFGAVLREAARVLRPGGRLLFCGVHPCLNGPFVEPLPGGGVTLHPTYRQAGWHDQAPWWKPGGIRSHTGMRHVPLAELLNGFIDAGLIIDHVAEPLDREIPFMIAIRCHAMH